MTKPDWCPADRTAPNPRPKANLVGFNAEAVLGDVVKVNGVDYVSPEYLARAILAERERALNDAAYCAENYRPWQRTPEANYGWATARTEIARDIRALKETP